MSPQDPPRRSTDAEIIAAARRVILAYRAEDDDELADAIDELADALHHYDERDQPPQRA